MLNAMGQCPLNGLKRQPLTDERIVRDVARIVEIDEAAPEDANEGAEGDENEHRHDKPRQD